MKRYALIAATALLTLGCETFITQRIYETNAGGSEPVGGSDGGGGMTNVGGTGGTPGPGGGGGVGSDCVGRVHDFGQDYDSLDDMEPCWTTKFFTSGDIDVSSEALVMIPAINRYWENSTNAPIVGMTLTGDFAFRVAMSVSLIDEPFTGAAIIAIDESASTDWFLASLADHGDRSSGDFGNLAWIDSSAQISGPGEFLTADGDNTMEIVVCRVGDQFGAFRRKEPSNDFEGFFEGEYMAAQTLFVGMTTHRYMSAPLITGSFSEAEVHRNGIVTMADCLAFFEG